MRRLLLSLTLALGLFGAAGLGVPAAHAQVQSGLAAVGQTIKLPDTDPRVIAARIINVALGLIGIILVVLILYAGFLYMTSGGEAEKTTRAKRIITNAIIGLIIILSAWAITRYVIESLLTATQDNGGVSGGGGGLGGGFGGSGGAEPFHVKSITPAGSVPIRNVEVKIIFNKAVDETSAGAIVITKVGGTTVGGTIKVTGAFATFTPAQDCPAPNQTRKCFDGNADFTVKVGGSVRSTQGQTVVCGGFASSCDGAFHTGNLVDTQPPTVNMSYPVNGQSVQVNFLQDVQADASDDSGIGAVEFFDGPSSIGIDAPTASTTPTQYSAKASWDTAGAVLGPHTLSAKASDIDTNATQSNSISVVVRPEHCFNGQMDAPVETGIDCGGDSNSPDFCGACSGGSCTQNSDCASGFCQNGLCIEKPVIQSVAPTNGKPGTFVTLKGVNFGYQAGTVTFLGAAGPQDDVVAVAPAACVGAGIATWFNTQAIVAVPVGAASGPIQIRNAGSGLTDETNDTVGPPIPNFLIDNTDHPGLCAIQPDNGSVGNQVDAIGDGFGGSAQHIEFGTTELSAPFALWSQTKVQFQVPVVNSAPYSVTVKTGTGESNPAKFTVVDKSANALPELQSVDPIEGPQQNYLTLFGKNFGYSVGVVIFTDSNAQEAIGDTSFPAQCSNGFWRDDRIVVKVPEKFKNNQPTTDGTYTVKVQRPDLKVSNTQDFKINSQLPLTPGICAVMPSLGPVGTPVELFGDRFGLTTPVVTFFQNKPAAVTQNNNQDVKTSVPVGALTGALQLKASNQNSNKVNFEVRNCNESVNACSPSTEQCCPTGECRLKTDSCGAKALTAEYAWQTSTGLIPVAPRVIEECRPLDVPSPTPSPSPWLGRQGGDQAPIDAAMLMRFTTLLDTSSVVPGSFHVYACKGAGADPCTGNNAKQDVAFVLHKPLVAENNNQQVVKLTPTQPFATSTTYLVTVASTIKSFGPSAISMDIVQSCGTGPGNETYGYCFRFKTKASTDPSKVGGVNVIPSPFVMHGAGETAPYEAVPLNEADKCIVLDCQKFDWDWHTANGDSRASVTNLKTNGKGLCDQVATGLVETGQAPVDIDADLLQSPPITGVGKLFINFVPPHVEEFAPNCNEACLNGYIWARFSSALDLTSVTTPGNIVVQKCYNQNCVESELAAPIDPQKLLVTLEPGTASPGDTLRKIKIDDMTLNGGQSPLEPGGFYHVLLKGGPNVQNGIIGFNKVPITGLNHPQGFFWNFRVKVGADAFCKAERVEVVPLEKYENNVNARQLFIATPFGHPDTCSASGQALIPNTSASWISSAQNIADIYTVNGALIDTGAKLPAGCTGNCLATGAVAEYGKVAVCGNGIIETTDTHYCDALTHKTFNGDTCTVLPPGAKGGEECESSLPNDGSKCSVSTCLWVPVQSASLGGTCGNAIVDVGQGEACDFGPTCIGASNATSSPSVPENTACTDPTVKTACAQAGGDCSMHAYRGCSPACRHLGSFAGQSTCGISDPVGDGKDCDDGNTTDGDGCSAQCLHEGSQAGSVLTSVCGNAVLEPGETCEKDSINVAFPSGCDTVSCLHTGKLSCASPNDVQCCGNGKIESGEDCDDTNLTSHDGCNSSCLFEGSSVQYSNSGSLAPSFCGNGIIEQGEQCEAGASSAKVAGPGYINYKSQNPLPSVANALGKGSGKGDLLIDPIQLAFIIGNGTPDPVTGKMSSDITVNVENQDGKAVYGLQCGFTDEASCLQYGPDLGLDDAGCCAQRPRVDTPYPPKNATGVCRNVQIKAIFNTPMNVGLTTNNFEVSQLVPTGDCPTGTQEIVVAPTYGPGMWNWVKKTWHSLVSWIQGGPAYAQKWCKGGVSGQLKSIGSPSSTTVFIFSLDHALDANTTYRLRFLGDNSTPIDPLSDNADKSLRWGVQTLRGVVHPYEADAPGELVWSFETGSQVCGVNVVTIADSTPIPPLPDIAHPFLFTNKGNQQEVRSFESTAQSIQNGIAVPLSPVIEYKWAWSPWTSSDDTIVGIVTSNQSQATADQATATSFQKEGTSVLTAQLMITNDEVNVPSTTDAVVDGVAPVSVLICENPWPSTPGISPFRDIDPTTGLSDFKPGDPFYGLGMNGYFNFSTMYCRDALKPNDKTDDVPALTINQVPKTALDTQNGILRQYLFSYPAEDSATLPDYRGLQADGVGIRIVTNPQHLSPSEWYRARGFKGAPKAVSVDGYPAIQDGPTLYVSAPNRPLGGSGFIFSNIYLISHNPDAKPVTLQVYDQMVKYLAFNINLQEQTNVCVHKNGSIYTSQNVNDGNPVKCSADWECLNFGNPNMYCDSLKKKLTRDMQRLTDFQAMSTALEGSKTPQGTYPRADSGTFLRNWTTSLWSSWAVELGNALGKAPQKDPVNHFLTCGRCEQTQTPCQSTNDCPSVQDKSNQCKGGRVVANVWTWDDKIDPKSCWDQDDHEYICPKIAQPHGVSRVYQYRSLVGGTRYDLGAEFEVPPTNPSNWWSPLLPDAVYKCVATSTAGVYCAGSNGKADDYLCRLCPNAEAGKCTTCLNGPSAGKFCTPANALLDCGLGHPCTDTMPVIIGSCRQFGGTFSYSNICSNVPQGDKSVCGDGVLYTDPNVPANSELCELGMSQTAKCTAQGNKPGHKQQVCDAKSCKKYVDDIQHPQCIADLSCGNGRVDKVCNNDVTKPCLGDSDCSNGQQCENIESCDDGVQNGSYGHCNASCTGYAGYCGDGLLSPGEICDEGANNGDYGGSCSLDCKGSGPFCGDTEVNGPEQCDASTDATQSKICNAPFAVAGKKVCDTDSDCGVGGSCGGTQSTQSCVGVTVTVNNIAYDTQHTRTCNLPGNPNQCKWPNWSSCQAIGSCGDGIVDTNEACDDGTENGDTKACTAVCKKNICGDGKPYSGVEDCDAGSQNGQITCSADYDSMCLSCSNLCKFQATAGGYCGDKVKNGPEQCDGTTPVGSSDSCATVAQPIAQNLNALCAVIASKCTTTDCGKTTESGLTCQQLGFDYSKKQMHPTITGPSSPTIANSELPWIKNNEPACALNTLPWYKEYIYHECAGVRCMADPLNNNAIQVVRKEPLVTTDEFWQCAVDKGAPVGINVNTTGGFVGCSSACAFDSCVRCSDEPGTSIIEGRVFDGLFAQVVPTARVSLLSKGVKVDEAFTDNDGYFKISTLNAHNECTGYRLVVDMYEDNICTGTSTRPTDGGCYDGLTPPWTYSFDIDESLQAGYFPYTSPSFNASTFRDVMNIESDEHVANFYIFPRPENGKAYAALNWKTIAGQTDNQFRQMHAVVPAQSAFTVADWALATPETTDDTSDSCDYDKRLTNDGQICTRDIEYHALGDWDTSHLPYGRAICLHHAGEKTAGSANPKYNGCPIEGPSSCLANHKNAIGELDNIYYPNVQTVDSCKNNPNNQKCIDCGADKPGHYSGNTPTCNDGGYWEDCWRVSYGPIAEYVNYAPMATNDSVKFYFGSWDPVSSFTSFIKNSSYEFTAYVATTYPTGEAQLYQFDKPTGNGYSWHLGNIDPATGTFTKKNVLVGNDSDTNYPPTKPTAGMACYRYQLQCPGMNSYCVNSSNKPKGSASTPLQMCFWPSEVSSCTGSYSCTDSHDWSAKDNNNVYEYYKYNW